MRTGMAVLYVAMLVAGWFWPVVTVAVFALMMAALLAGKRKKWCSGYCPRGSFLDKGMAHLSPRRPLPKWLVGPHVWKVSLALFVTAVGVQFWLTGLWHAFSWTALGTVLYRMCLVSSAIALPVALALHHRTWCAVCPVGNLLRR